MSSFRPLPSNLPPWKVLGSSRTSVFETRTRTGSELFSLLTCLHTTTFTLLSIISPLEMIRIQIWETKNHNTLCLSPQSLHKHCFQFLLGLTMVPRENKNNACAKFKGTNKEYYGIFRSGLWTFFRNVTQCHLKKSFAGLQSPGRSYFT